jgi:probable O-glycosylation ligase (exosortase A-associated)
VRDLALLMAVLVMLGMTLRYPFVGVLMWTWIAIQNPHMEAWGFIRTTPVNFIVALVTVVSWLVSRERKVPPTGFIFWMLVLFLAWMTLGSFFALTPSWSWTHWDRVWKVFALGLIVAATATTRMRIQALLWTIVLSLFYYGVKGGLFTIATGGHYHVFGPPDTIIQDNNQLAVAIMMALPLANYLRNYTVDNRIGHLLLAAMVLAVISVVGTYSRGALIGLGALGFLGLLRMRRRFLYITAAAALVFFTVQFMPHSYFDRMDTITAAQSDESFHGRIIAWRVAYNVAKDHFPFGAGFYGPQVADVFHQYFPHEVPHAAHSIYFQVLGEHGFIGLGMYLIILGAVFLKCSKLISVARKDPEQRWIADLAVAIQASLFVFCVSGAALSIAYYDLMVIDASLMLPLWEIVRGRAKQAAWRPVPAEAPG